MHGTGNDFVVIDATARRFVANPALLRALTDRRYGVGCDQVLVIESADNDDVDFNYRIFNADGSEVGQCGNGSRCLARFVIDRGLSDKKKIRVRTATTVLELEVLDDNRVRVDMGRPQFSPVDIPLRVDNEQDRYRVSAGGRSIEFGAVSMGNPHLVTLVDDVDAAPVESLGPELEGLSIFPQRVNAGFLQIESRQRAALRVFERGSGETLACGSGACAAIAVARRWNLVDEHVSVRVRGGELQVEWKGGQSPVFLTGPAETVFEGQLCTDGISGGSSQHE